MKSPEKQFEHAVAAYQSGKFIAAKKIITKLERDVGPHPQILHLKAFLEVETSKAEIAIAALETAAQHFPNDPNLFNALAVSLRKTSRYADAEAAFLRAIELNPHDAAYFQNFGNFLSEAGRLSEAISVYQQALNISPDLTKVALSLAMDLNRVGQISDAKAVLETQLQRDPEQIDIRLQLASLAHHSSNLSEAQKWYLSVAETDPGNADAISGLMSIGVLQGNVEQALARYENWHKTHGGNYQITGAYVHALNYRPNIDPTTLRDAAESIPAPFRLSGSPPSITDKNRTLRIGIISRHFGPHPVSYFSKPLLGAGLSGDFEFEIFASHVSENDTSKLIQSRAHQWHDITHMDRLEQATFIRSRNLDIAISPSGHEESDLLDLFRARLAPVQITAFGIFGTTGIKQIDGLLTDEYHCPAGTEDHFTEDLIHMPDGYVCFEPYEYLPAIDKADRHSTPIFGSFNNIAKICDDTLSLWSSVLSAVPGGILVVKTTALADSQTREMLMKRALAAGIAAERLVLEGPSSHVELLKSYLRVDVALDPLAYSGGLTTLESLWMGTPVVTLPGRTFARRHSLSHLSVAGLGNWVANSQEQYVNIAAELAEEAISRKDMRSWLRDKMVKSPTSDAQKYARDFSNSVRAFIK